MRFPAFWNLGSVDAVTAVCSLSKLPDGADLQPCQLINEYHTYSIGGNDFFAICWLKN